MPSPDPAALLAPNYLGGPDIDGSNCAREAIHLPGSIQPYGALLVLGEQVLGEMTEGWRVLQVSENVGGFLGGEASAWLGQPLEAVVGPEVAQELLAALPAGTPDRLQFRQDVTAGAGTLTLTAHRAGERLIAELEHPQQVPGLGNHLRNAVFALETAPGLQGLLEVAVKAARDLSGFDRVMLYRFLEDDSGEVVAESRREDLQPFLHHRFPESDIPAQARALYVRHLLRLTADVYAAPALLTPRVDPQTGQPTQLGGAVLRATSPMHIQYLKNMGVASSLSVSIVVDGRLWGLISCHHTSAHITPPVVRDALEELGRLLNVQVQLKSQADIAAYRAQLAAGHQQVINAAARTLTPLATLSDPALGLRELLGASGLALYLEGQWRTLGQVPEEALTQLLEALRQQSGQTTFATDHLSGLLPEAAQWPQLASGLLAVSIGKGWQEAALWFRPEEKLTTIWGGATPEEAKSELGPRQSFDSYAQQMRGHSRAWQPGEVAEAALIAQSLSATLGERLQTLRKLNEGLQRSNEEWRKFAFVIAHDMHEPVRLVGQFMELFSLRQGQQTDAQTQKLMRFLVDETARIGSLMGDLYTYTELLSYPELKRQTVSLTWLLQASLQELGALAEQKELVYQPPQDINLSADPVKLQLALTQLLRNALSFGRPPVHIRVEAQQDAAQTTIFIQDDGPGIAPEYRERVFELFQRLGPQGSGGGNGVGLALARKVAQLHGGTLRIVDGQMVEGQMVEGAGTGTCLQLTLPHPSGATP